MTHQPDQHRTVLRHGRARTRVVDPLDALLRRGAQQETDPIVKRWLERLLTAEEHAGDRYQRDLSPAHARATQQKGGRTT